MTNPGYTLVELLIVLAIMGLLAMVAAPLLSGPTERLQATAATRFLAERLRAARELAVDKGTTQRIVVGRSLAPRGTKLLFHGPLRNEIDFFPDGSTSGGTIVVVTSGGTRHRVRVQWPAGQIAIDD
jgi:prepilin-type N-terminal cleavage/methylation domain-containing protein